MKQYRLLVCDVNIQKAGHWLSYNQYILDNFEKIEKEHPFLHVSFLFNKEAEGLVQLDKNLKDRVHFLNDSFEKSTGAKKRYLIFKSIKEFSESRKIDHLVFMELDRYQLTIFLSAFKFRISGILFRPHHRIEPTNKQTLSVLFNRYKRYKKRLTEKLLVYKWNYKNIFILNDISGANKLNSIYKCDLFKYIPEPVFSYPLNSSLPLEIKPDPGAYKYLIFGSMDERKNITNILRAYDETKFPMDTQLIIAGPASEEYIVYLKSLIDSLPSIDNNRKKVLIRVGFFSGDEMDYFFSISDVCLLIYKNSFGSSALIGRASFHKIKVIGPNVGLLSEIIEKYNLGITSDPNDIKQIGDSLLAIQKIKVNDFNFEEFYRKNSPEVYLRTLLDVEV